MPSELRVAVVGLGKIGLPLAVQYASKGANVIGCDANPGIVNAVNEGACPIVGEPGLPEALATAVRDERLRASTNTSDAVSRSNVVVIIVPVGIDDERQPDFSHLDSAAEDVGRGLRAGTLVILETTVPVGITRGRLRRRLMAASGLRSKGDFFLAYSPERVSSGSMLRDLKAYPKLVGGVDPESAEAAASFYRQVLDADVTLVSDAETAEFAKLAESVYRDLNIALANQLARTAADLGIDYYEAAAAANSQPFSHLHAPGLGVGGHCIPVYPYFLPETAGADLVSLGRRINDSMARYGVDVLESALIDETGVGLRGQSVLILGLAYRGGVKEATLSSALLIVQALEERGARVLVHDPLFTDVEIATLGLTPAGLTETTAEAVVLQAAHREYDELDVASLGCSVFLDGRRAFERSRVENAGVRYVAIGLGR
jgi:nucleotide sugar dehydrogenase